MWQESLQTINHRSKCDRKVYKQYIIEVNVAGKFTNNKS